MKRIIIILLTLAFSFGAKAQFPTTDSLRAFINRYIRNSAVEAFQNLRLNTALIGMTNYLDSSYGGQVDTFMAVNDTTARIITLGGDTMDITIRGASNITLTNVGTGYSLVTTPNGSIKRLNPGYGFLMDSTTTANTITTLADTSSANHLITQSDLNDAIAGVTISPAGSDRQIQINDAGVFGVHSGFVITTDGTVISDSVRGKSFITTGDTTVTSKIIFPNKKSRGSIPFRIGYDEQNNAYNDGHTVNTIWEWRLGALNGTGKYVRGGAEYSWLPFPGASYEQPEVHIAEIGYGPDLSNLVVRPGSWTGSWLGNDGTWLWKANLHSFYDWNGQKALGGFSRGAGEFTTYHNYTGNAFTEMSIRDTGTSVRAAGMRIDGQVSGGVRTNTTDYYGQQIYNYYETGPVFRTGKAGANSIGFNYVFNILDTNTNHVFMFTKGAGLIDNVYAWMHNDGRFVVGDANNFFSTYKFQAKNGTASFLSGDFDANNTSILYSAAFAHALTSGAGAAGFGAGFSFRGDNGSNTQTDIATIAGAWTSATAGAENGDIIFRTRRAGTLTEAARVKANGHVSTTDEAYDATAWNGNTEVPTKNAIRDKIESLGSGITSINSMTGPAITIQGGTGTSVSSSTNTVTVEVVPSSTALAHTLDVQYVTQGNTGTSETDLFTYTLPANKLSVDGRTVNFEIDGEVNDNTATAQIKLYFAGNVTLNTGAVNISTANTGWRLKGYIVRTSSTTAHVTYELHAPGLATAVFVGYNNLTSLDFTAGNIFKITAQAGGAGGGNSDITAHSWQVTYKPIPL